MSAAAPRIRHGIDLVHVPRFAAVLREREAFEAAVFTDDERAYCNRFPDPAPHFAARFAAKEAALKALGMGIMATGVDRKLKQIEIVRVGTAPTLAFTGKPAAEARRLGVRDASVSLTHDGEHAMATVMLLAEGGSA